MMIGIEGRRLWAIVVLVCLTASHSASGAELDVAYVKTLGQTNPLGEPLKGTGRRQVAVDTQGNLIVTVGIGHPWTAITKVGPNGRVIWETDCGGYGNLPVVVADDFVYAVSSEILLRRYSLATGKLDETWGYQWVPDKPDIRGVRKFETASGMVASAKYLYISDSKAKSIRRFDRLTSAEKPLSLATLSDEPLDLAIAKDGNLLVLTSKGVVEIDPDGKVLRNPLITGMIGPQGIDVDSFTGEIYISLGGTPAKPVNQIWQYTADGKATGVKLGRGGDFNGRWTPDTFAFATGAADFTLDASGGVWVNTGLGQLTHFTAAPDFRHVQTLVATPEKASDVAADADLNVYVAVGLGQLKMNWNGDIQWSCHLQPGGDPERYPGSPGAGWPIYIAYAGHKSPIFYLMDGRSYYSLSPETGQLVGSVMSVRSNLDAVSRMTSTGDLLYCGGGGEKDAWKIVTASHKGTANWTPFLTPPSPLQGALMGVSRDQQRTYLWHKDRVQCIDSKGKGWQAASPGAYARNVQPVAFLDDDVIFLNGDDHAVVARDARTGQLLGTIGNKEVAGRPAISRVNGLAVASKEGSNYLFILCNHQIQVFEVTFRK